ncbi:allograft inflammatory factor-1 [Plakobranchus ocellatus]|uniref:Allograft inflammatory factor-1 n=1 Tax=Plakobranchus ocellatus TaxID=259542 RepID=A0AAV3ZDE2_9GAST|nr:allograft inflammatory factor-1 [Plakobranchus ocellatus]
MANLNPTDKQGGKAYGQHMAKWEAELDEINKGFLQDGDYDDVDDLEFKLSEFKNKFIECDRDRSGDLNVMDVKYLMEKLGQAKTHVEVVKMISEVDSHNQGAINYTDFVRMMLGPKSSVLKIILLFEGLGKPQERPKGPPPKKDLSSLP